MRDPLGCSHSTCAKRISIKTPGFELNRFVITAAVHRDLTLQFREIHFVLSRTLAVMLESHFHELVLHVKFVSDITMKWELKSSLTYESVQFSLDDHVRPRTTFGYHCTNSSTFILPSQQGIEWAIQCLDKVDFLASHCFKAAELESGGTVPVVLEIAIQLCM